MPHLQGQADFAVHLDLPALGQGRRDLGRRLKLNSA